MGRLPKKKQKAVAPDPQPVDPAWANQQPTGFVGPNQEPLGQPQQVAQPTPSPQPTEPQDQVLIIGKEVIDGQMVWKVKANYDLGNVGDVIE